MAQKEQKRRRDSFKSEEAALRSILNQWDPIPGSPHDEYDSLVHELLGHLHRSARREDLPRVIDQHLRHYMGIIEASENVDNVAQNVWTWWRQRAGSRDKDA
jgi:hypothetical protein